MDDWSLDNFEYALGDDDSFPTHPPKFEVNEHESYFRNNSERGSTNNLVWNVGGIFADSSTSPANNHFFHHFDDFLHQGADMSMKRTTSAPANDSRYLPVHQPTAYRPMSVSDPTTYQTQARMPRLTLPEKRYLAKKISREKKAESLDKALKRKNSSGQITSRYNGVSWYKRTSRWVVQVKIAGIRKHIGYFSDEDIAGKAYQTAYTNLYEELSLSRSQKNQLLYNPTTYGNRAEDKEDILSQQNFVGEIKPL